MRALRAVDSTTAKRASDTWLFTIARNLVIDLSRKRSMVSLDEMSEPNEDGRAFEIAARWPLPAGAVRWQ